MPELPEAETIVRGLRPFVGGLLIERVEVLRPDILGVPPEQFRSAVEGRTLGEVERRGKKVVLMLQGGGVLLVNLGMTGRLLLSLPARGAPQWGTHPALRFSFAGGGNLVYDDIRRFGLVECLSAAEWAARSEGLGPEPLAEEFTPERFSKALAASRAPIRSWLLDQRKVAGVGNIYANEALWRARIHPRRPAREVRPAEVKRLHEALRAVLGAAIEARGTTLRDYRTAEGERGENADALCVYGREASPCPRCSTPVERLVIAGRSAFLCPSCQPELP